MISPQSLLSRAVQFQIQTQRSYNLNQLQINSLSRTLLVLQLLLENLIVTRSSRPEVLHNIELLLDELQLLVAGQVSAATTTSQLSGTVKYPTIPKEVEVDIDINSFQDPEALSDNKYGLFHDRISNLSPSASTRSINEIEEDEFEDEFATNRINGMKTGHGLRSDFYGHQNVISSRNDYFRHNAEQFESARGRN